MTLATSLPFALEREAQQVATDLNEATLRVVDRHEEIITEFPPLPYTTATLHEDATRAFNWTISQVTQLAQTLFETGLITYPRTDSVRVAEEAIEAGKQVITALYGKESLGHLVGENFPQPVETDSDLEAHEAIRPTSPNRHPDDLLEGNAEAHVLYRLIWARFLASLMNPARYRVITLALEAEL
ncbi:MAG: hypothetical protein HUU38_25190 [Anaerolineales bacterium]|nr:hypothetical protein [Anaerolineales bacterium]